MKNYRVYINAQGWELFSKTNSPNEATYILDRMESKEVPCIVVEHDTELNSDTPYVKQKRTSKN